MNRTILMENNTSSQLFKLLLSRDYDPKTLDSSGKSVTDVSDADIFSFDFTHKDDNYGTVVILLGNEKNFEIYFGDNIGNSLSREAKNNWYDLLYQLRMFAKRNLLSFGLKNINKLKHSMKGLSAINEGLFEGWNGTSKSSYNKQKGKTKIIVRHNKRLGETDQRFRNIESIFIENSQGERFKVPFKSIGGARAMARHVAEGGTPYDIFGAHITETVNSINVLNNFLRIKPINESESYSKIVETCGSYNKKLKKNLKLMSGVRGYKSYTESWTPSEIDNDNGIVEQISNLLIPEGSSDSRITDVLPVLASYLQEYRNENQQVNESKRGNMKEALLFEDWAETLTEGTWAFPDTDDQIKVLKDIMSTELPVGIDATNATEVLYDVLGDDKLFDALGKLADENPDADARDTITDFLKDQGYNDILDSLK